MWSESAYDLKQETAFDAALIIRYTRHWIHYGSIVFVVFCTAVGALRGLTHL